MKCLLIITFNHVYCWTVLSGKVRLTGKIAISSAANFRIKDRGHSFCPVITGPQDVTSC